MQPQFKTPMKKTKNPATKNLATKKTKTKTAAKPVKRLPANKPAKVVAAKVSIEAADLDNMSKEEILITYAEEIEEHGDWIYREQDRGGPTYSREQCIEQAKQEVMDGTWPCRDFYSLEDERETDAYVKIKLGDGYKSKHFKTVQEAEKYQRRKK